jgi:hypothetical protein
MSKPIPNSPTAHVVVSPSTTQNYYAVVSANSGHELVRCETAAQAAVEQARLEKRDSYTIRR